MLPSIVGDEELERLRVELEKKRASLRGSVDRVAEENDASLRNALIVAARRELVQARATLHKFSTRLDAADEVERAGMAGVVVMQRTVIDQMARDLDAFSRRSVLVVPSPIMPAVVVERQQQVSSSPLEWLGFQPSKVTTSTMNATTSTTSSSSSSSAAAAAANRNNSGRNASSTATTATTTTRRRGSLPPEAAPRPPRVRVMSLTTTAGGDGSEEEEEEGEGLEVVEKEQDGGMVEVSLDGGNSNNNSTKIATKGGPDCSSQLHQLGKKLFLSWLWEGCTNNNNNTAKPTTTTTTSSSSTTEKMKSNNNGKGKGSMVVVDQQHKLQMPTSTSVVV